LNPGLKSSRFPKKNQHFEAKSSLGARWRALRILLTGRFQPCRGNPNLPSFIITELPSFLSKGAHPSTGRSRDLPLQGGP
jgi:hypothetical protein